jgi:hypothetical protein
LHAALSRPWLAAGTLAARNIGVRTGLDAGAHEFAIGGGRQIQLGARRRLNVAEQAADALEADEADEELVAETFRQLAAATASIEDAAETAGVIDAETAEWRAINDLRASTYHAAAAIRLNVHRG